MLVGPFSKALYQKSVSVEVSLLRCQIWQIKLKHSHRLCCQFTLLKTVFWCKTWTLKNNISVLFVCWTMEQIHNRRYNKQSFLQQHLVKTWGIKKRTDVLITAANMSLLSICIILQTIKHWKWAYLTKMHHRSPVSLPQQSNLFQSGENVKHVQLSFLEPLQEKAQNSSEVKLIFASKIIFG